MYRQKPKRKRAWFIGTQRFLKQEDALAQASKHFIAATSEVEVRIVLLACYPGMEPAEIGSTLLE